MKFSRELTDESILTELGSRLMRARLERNYTQANFAEQAGVSKRTIERLESGKVAVQLSAFLRVCRSLDLIERLEMLIPDVATSPIAELELQRRKRRRASKSKEPPTQSKKWKWGDES